MCPPPHQDDALLKQVLMTHAAVDGIEEGQRAQAADLIEGDVHHDVVDQALEELDLCRS